MSVLLPVEGWAPGSPNLFLSLPNVLFKISKKNINKNEKSNSKNGLPEKPTKDKSPKDMSLYESFKFSAGIIGVI